MIEDRIDVNIAGGLDIPLPRMVPVEVTFESPVLKDIAQTVKEQFKAREIKEKIKPGGTIAIGCGSRGVASVAEVARAVVSEIKELGGNPFIFPAMASHGAATAEGQKKVLESYGITEDYVGCPLRATMDTVIVETLEDGTKVHVDRYAAESDGIVLINRIKVHTNFRGPFESGIVKMMTIGMGKIHGATEIHFHGFEAFDELLPKLAKIIMGKLPFLFGVGVVENAREQIAKVEVIPAESLFEREPELLALSKELMPKLLFDTIDVLIIDEIGKDISGSGFDPNVTGRNNRFIPWSGPPDVQKIVLLDLTGKTHGNATGLGLADVITMKLYRKMDIASTYANLITATYLDGASIPMIMNTEEEAIRLAVKTLRRVRPQNARIVRIKNTLELTRIMVSEPMLTQVEAHPQMKAVGAASEFPFDRQGNLRAA
ncbi:MAG: DUF2088 domain-containing protein [Deltaproteobacteria bacterium]|nr:DUF2088 domain-containing protein [Deltaproteobacteria bacterium]MBW2152378.1 DUF2088 domain-containing protein [Deltaproteobacteria bacterium]